MSCFACCSKNVQSDDDDISAQRGDSVTEAGNGSLYDHLFDPEANNRDPLNWETRVKIALGVACELQYLHSEASPPVIHRNLKSANILLDNDFNPKLSNFGTHLTTRDMDPVIDRYFDPEYAMSGKITLKSDIYSFGVVLLELLTGRQAFDLRLREGEEQLVEWFFREARPLMQNAESNRFMRVLDPLIGGHPPPFPVLDLLVTVDKCLREQAKRRPRIERIVQVLQRCLNHSDSDYFSESDD